MHKVVVVPDASLLSLVHRSTRRSSLTSHPLQDNFERARFASWVPLDYSVAQLAQDAARHWRIAPSKCELCECRSKAPLDSATLISQLLLEQLEPNASMTLTLRQKNTAVASLYNRVSPAASKTMRTTAPALLGAVALSSRRDDPFWIQEKLFELFLFYALQNMNGKALWVTCYQFKSLLQRAMNTSLAAPSSSRSRSAKGSGTKSSTKLEFDTRVLLAFKGAVASSSGSGAGATFDEFLDALVDVASFVFPKVSPKALAFETLTTKFVIPQFEREQYAGSASTLSWTQMDALLMMAPVQALLQRFAKLVGALAAAYSTTIGGAQSCRGLQFREFSRFMHELELKSLAVSSSELCDVFIRCCRLELSQHYSDATTLTSLYFASATPSKCASSSTGSSGHAALSTFSTGSRRSSRTVSAGGNFTIHGGGASGDRGNALTESGGALEIMCGKAMNVLGYVALVTAPPLAKVKDQLQSADFTTLSLTPQVAQLSIKALLHHIANHFSGKSAHRQQQQPHHRYASKTTAASALACVQFLHEFQKMHHEDAMTDYLSELSREIRVLAQRGAKQPHPLQQQDESASNGPDEREQTLDGVWTGHHKLHHENEGFDLSVDWSDGNSDRSDSASDSDTSDDESNSPALASLDPQLLQALRLREIEDLTELLNDGDEIYTFLASELQRHALLDRRTDDTNTVAQMLDMWVAAGQKYAQVLAHIDAVCGNEANSSPADRPSLLVQLKPSVLHRFGCSLSVFARQLLRHTTRVYAYEEFFAVTNARVYGVSAACWDDSSSVFTTDLAMETLSLASAKLTSACAELEPLVSPRINESNDPVSADDSAARSDCDPMSSPSPRAMYAKYIDCVFHRANCLAAYGDTLAHNRLCSRDYELGCVLEEELEAIHTASSSSRAAASALHGLCSSATSKGVYRSASTLSKTSPPGQFYREATRMLRFIVAHAHEAPQLPLVRVHLALASAQFKLATHLPRGCVVEKKLLEDALVHLAMAQAAPLSAAERDTVSERKEYISAILVLRHKFFQPEAPPPPLPSSSVEELISPFYRFVLAAAFRDLDTMNAGVLTQSQLSELNRVCGRSDVSDATMEWLVRNFDQQSGGLTEKGLLQYFCWVAEADPLAFCEILDVFTSKYTETHHASITTSRPSNLAKEPRAKSLRSILFAERRQLTTSSPVAAAKPAQPAADKTGIAECVVVLSGKMTPGACGDISKTQSPADIRLEPDVVDLLPSNASLPDELSKFCFPDDVFLYEEPLPPKTFDIVLTDIKGERLYGSCLHFYEEKDPMEVLALIASVQRGKSASLPSWISLRDIQQHKTRWKCFVPKCLCVLSSYPLFETFRTFVTQLYRLSLSAPLASAMETFVFHLLAQVALPPSNLVQTSFRLLDRACLLTGCAPGQSTFYPAEVDFTVLFQCLSPENILKVYAYLLTEKKVVVCSDNCSILTPVMETLRALLHPLECQVVYIPVLPLSLLDFVSAPVPFFMGVRSDARVAKLTTEGIVVVDLDKNEVALPPSELLPSLPDVKAKKLLQALRKASTWAAAQRTKEHFGRFRDGDLAPLRLVGAEEPLERDISALVRRQDDLIDKWSELQTLFTTFATRMLKDVRKYCAKVVAPRDPSETIAFDRRGFLTTHPSLREFCAQLFQTQLFQRFVERSTQDGGAAALGGTEPEVSWLSARSKSVIWKSEPAEDAAKAPVRQVLQAPSPFARHVRVCGTERSQAQRRASLTATDAFPTFNAAAFDELMGQRHVECSSSSSAVAPISESASTTALSSEGHKRTEALMSLTPAISARAGASAALPFRTSDTPASKLVSAARQRLEGPTPPHIDA